MINEIPDYVTYCDNVCEFDEMISTWLAQDLNFQYSSECVYGDNKINMCHLILSRPEECEEQGIPHEPQSNLIGFARNMLDSFLIKTNNPHKYEILRAAINFTFRQGESRVGAMHFDHDYPHKQFLMTLNKTPVGGGTCIKDGDNEYFLPSLFNRAYMFDSIEHACVEPDSGARILLVVTLRFVDE